MRAYEVFGSMPVERASELFAALAKEAPGVYAQAMAVTGAAMNARPQFLMRQKPAKRADLIRRALSRVRANEMSEEVLATYFIDCRRELLVEWLDLVGLEHEDGVLGSDSPECPPREKIVEATASFRKAGAGSDSEADRELLLRAFAAQQAVDWPDLEEAIG